MVHEWINFIKYNGLIFFEMEDKISKVVLSIIDNSEEPLETKETEKLARAVLKDITRTKLFYRLTMLRAEREIKGKFIGPGRGVWIWWRKYAFHNE
ncbi:MAG: hypothetical protein QXH64_04910 [Nitrososphaeria archaeon]